LEEFILFAFIDMPRECHMYRDLVNHAWRVMNNIVLSSSRRRGSGM